MKDRKDRSERRERRRAGSAARDARHRAGGNWTTINIPEGISVFQPKEGTVRFDIVPYEVGEGNPYAKPGEWYYERTYYVHAGVGPNRESYTCPSKTANKRCPICEYRAKLARDPDGDENMVKSLRPRERQLFLIHLAEENNKEVMLYESSYSTFGKLLDRKRQDAEDDEVHITDFDDPDAGSTLKVSYREEDAGSFKYLECYSIEFRPRPNGLDPDLLEHGICLDKVVRVMDYEELKRIFFQEDIGDQDEPSVRSYGDDGHKSAGSNRRGSEPKKAPQTARTADTGGNDREDPAKSKREPSGPLPGRKLAGVEFEEGERVQTRRFGICEVLRIGKDGTLTVEDSEGDVHSGVPLDEVRKFKEPQASGKGSKTFTNLPAEPKQKSLPAMDSGGDDWDEGSEFSPPAARSLAKAGDDDDWD